MKTWLGGLSFIVVLIAIGVLNLYCCGMKFESNSAGVIISCFGVIVTCLIGWQVWQVLDTKTTIKQMKEQVNTERTERAEQLKKYSEQLSLFTFAANCANDAIMIQTELHHIVHNNLSSARGKTGYNEAYFYLLRALRDAVKADVSESERLIDICLDNMLSCLNSAEELKERYEDYALFNINLGAECDAVYKSIKDKYPNGLNRRQALILDELQNRRKNLTVV